MNVKATVTIVQNAFVITKGDKVETLEGIQALDNASTIRAILNAQKGMGTLQNAHQTFLHHVLNRPLLDSVKGKGDVTKGTLPENMKEYTIKAELSFVQECHAAGIKGIPSTEAGQIDLAKAIRSDKNYSNIKTSVMKYFAFCGKLPMTSAGILVPKQVMIAEINAALNVAPVDNSLYAKLIEIKGILDKSTLDEKQSRQCEPMARELASILKGLVAHYDEMRTNAAQAMPVNAGVAPAVASEAIGKAKKGKTPEAGAVLDIPALV